jgi:hypothetical protein
VKYLALVLVLLLPLPALGQEVQCPEGYTCVENQDMAKFLELAEDYQCRAESLPEIDADAINIIVDRDGRVYGSGTGEYPFTVRMDWCNYFIEAKSQVTLHVAQRVEKDWGFRLRIKANFGVMFLEAFREDTDEFQDVIDGGILVEPFFYHWVNLNAHVGVRSLGAGLGADLTTNFGLYGGYALTWGSWRSTPILTAYFAF